MDFIGGMFNLTAKEKEYAGILMGVIGKGELDQEKRVEFAQKANITVGAVYVWVKKLREKQLLVGNTFNPVIRNTGVYTIKIEMPWTKGKYAIQG